MIFFARYRSTALGVTGLISHAFEVRHPAARGRELTARCGRSFAPDGLAVLPGWTGSRCPACALDLSRRSR
ncbi:MULTISPECIES: hypothetical protein [unclassified Saccharopolyspora]|uniref:hypothetical protein n=1 Tax=unclassified Saccharopolyspora TaxID=2646250 RepID=UPI001CD2612B|nr:MULTISPECIES: hypothetical protein [unclassified Saccharopolyspora]MCA1188097.1 hypothetical protein [Saccharopolyspora sp. 6T]MCA1193980.1 hypothetical protein [Saccharopolyspora sp. 6V]MCA1228676.1 hypothetical protein [Saccharopolyspora sp. 6M]MCA1279292.1 hypothetical protein [Saccharopolyspora sp. 7B]